MTLLPLADRPEAVALLAEWHYREWHHLYPRESLQDFAADLQHSLQRGTVPCTWILQQGDAVWGSASVLERDMDTNTDLGPWLANVYIHPERRGRGLGRQLIRDVMAECRAMGIDKLYLFTPDQERFYQSLGWQTRKHERYHGEEVCIMQASLSGNDSQA